MSATHCPECSAPIVPCPGCEAPISSTAECGGDGEGLCYRAALAFDLSGASRKTAAEAWAEFHEGGLPNPSQAERAAILQAFNAAHTAHTSHAREGV